MWPTYSSSRSSQPVLVRCRTCTLYSRRIIHQTHSTGDTNTNRQRATTTHMVQKYGPMATQKLTLARWPTGTPTEVDMITLFICCSLTKLRTPLATGNIYTICIHKYMLCCRVVYAVHISSLITCTLWRLTTHFYGWGDGAFKITVSEKCLRRLRASLGTLQNGRSAIRMQMYVSIEMCVFAYRSDAYATHLRLKWRYFSHWCAGGRRLGF